MDLDFSSSLPDTGSSISVPGLDSEVTILIDIHGIPHIGPSTIMMLFLGRGLRRLRIGCGIWILIGDRPMGDGLNLWVVEVWKVTK